ncbi:MAG: S1 RNA-binding domain-containing protein [Bacilli bacterium]|nr:S1 RNA-binding domain-containing protein [Bacilli bacterium]
MNKYQVYESQVLPDRLNTERTVFESEEDLLVKLKQVLKNKETIFAYCNLVDQKNEIMELEFLENSKIIGYVPTEEISFDRSHIGRGITHLGMIVGVKILEIEEEKNGIIKVKCSRKEHGAEVYKKLTNDVKKGALKEGMIIKGIVDGMEHDKVYIDIGCGDIMAMLGVADIARAYVREPSEVLQLEQEVELVVKKIYIEPLKISLSRAMLMDGWESIDKKYRAGTIVPGTVKNRMATGVFIALDESFEGLAENIPTGTRLNYGDKVKVSILTIDKKREKIRLKIISNK